MSTVSVEEMDNMLAFGGYVLIEDASKFKDVYTDGERIAVWRLDISGER